MQYVPEKSKQTNTKITAIAAANHELIVVVIIREFNPFQIHHFLPVVEKKCRQDAV